MGNADPYNIVIYVRERRIPAWETHIPVTPKNRYKAFKVKLTIILIGIINQRSLIKRKAKLYIVWALNCGIK